MRQDKTVARIFHMFFIANVVLAVPVLVRQSRLETDRAGDGPMGEPEQDPAGSVHPATPPRAGPETPSDIWPEDDLNEWVEWLAKSSENFLPNSPSGGLHQGLVPSTGALQSNGDLPPLSGLENSRLQDPSRDSLYQYGWWLHSPPGTLTSGDSSHEMLPPALEDRPSQIHHPPALEDHSLQIYPETLEAHSPDDNPWWWHDVESITVKDLDKASTMSWASEPPEWKEEEAKVADETRLHL